MKRINLVLAVIAVVSAFTLASCGSKAADKPAASEAQVSEVVSEVQEGETASEAPESEVASEAPESEVVSEAQEGETASETPESGAASEATESGLEETSGEKYTYEGVTITLPEGFQTTESGGIGYVYTPTYPGDGDNITFANSNEKYEDYSAEMLDKTFSTVFDDFEGVTGYTEYEIGGYPALTYEYDASYQGTTLHQKQIAIFANKAVFITFTGLNYPEEFKAIENSITVE